MLNKEEIQIPCQRRRQFQCHCQLPFENNDKLFVHDFSMFIILSFHLLSHSDRGECSSGVSSCRMYIDETRGISTKQTPTQLKAT